MADDFDATALMIALDLVEQGGMPDEAERLRDLVNALQVMAACQAMAGEDLRRGDLLMRGDHFLYYRLRVPFRAVGIAETDSLRYCRVGVSREAVVGRVVFPSTLGNPGIERFGPTPVDGGMRIGWDLPSFDRHPSTYILSDFASHPAEDEKPVPPPPG